MDKFAYRLTRHNQAGKLRPTGRETRNKTRSRCRLELETRRN